MTDVTVDYEQDESLNQKDYRAQLEASVADMLASLSEVFDAPNGITAASSPFLESDVNFNTGAWISRITEVQGWLNFSDELPDTSEKEFLTALISELGLSRDEGLDSEGAPMRLSVKALESLVARLETATELQRYFRSQIEIEGVSKSSASDGWFDAWEENANDDPVSPEPVRAKADVWPIYQLTDSPLDLAPSYQRGDVWGSKDRSALIESILRGIPLPSIILLRKKGSEPHEVVDGKQRLTTILRFVGAHPIAREKLDEANKRHPGSSLEKLFHEDYPTFRRAWKNLEGETLTTRLENEYYFPFKLRRGSDSALHGEDLAPLQGKYYSQIRNQEISVADQELEVFQLFEKPVDYKIPVIEYTKAEPRQIHEVFKLYNKQGVHLNAEEIRNAVYHDVELTRAILFAAGDADPRRGVADIAESLVNVSGLNELAASLSDYRFGDVRYRRTKVLAWVVSVLLNDTRGNDMAATASHINQFLGELQEHPEHKLHQHRILANLFRWIAQSVELHSGWSDQLWSMGFRDGAHGQRWQELQLVGTLVGIALAVYGAPDDIEERLESHAEQIYAATESAEWQRPEKTQTRSQWVYIAHLAKGVLEILQIDSEAASNAVRTAYGSCGYESLQRMASR